jgi:hypothetical protein
VSQCNCGDDLCRKANEIGDKCAAKIVLVGSTHFPTVVFAADEDLLRGLFLLERDGEFPTMRKNGQHNK